MTLTLIKKIYINKYVIYRFLRQCLYNTLYDLMRNKISNYIYVLYRIRILQLHHINKFVNILYQKLYKLYKTLFLIHIKTTNKIFKENMFYSNKIENSLECKFLNTLPPEKYIFLCLPHLFSLIIQNYIYKDN
ncbi:hypothetical protein H312_01471 [Anncaliia algerae PRA339]|uniref:Uncharacterized protein n=1 Tax=Anncaliia algerae PRA339 TaxID=1288291 RepID=A0A059F1S0_9MICR|nr:hypothetical protein H312_01471 [Anncaliia algerae PRA339]